MGNHTRKLIALIMTAILLVTSLATTAGVTLAAVDTSLDKCSGTFNYSIGSSSTSFDIYRGSLSVWNNSSSPAAMSVVVDAQHGAVISEMHDIESSAGIDSLSETKSDYMAWTAWVALTATTYRETLQLANNELQPLTAIVLTPSNDFTGIITYTGGSVEYVAGRMVFRNSSSSPASASFVFTQMVANLPGEAAPYTGNAYLLVGTNHEQLSSGFTPQIPTLTGVGGVEWTLTSLTNLPAFSALVTTFCGGSTYVPVLAPSATQQASGGRACNFTPSVGLVVHPMSSVVKRSQPTTNSGNNGTAYTNNSITITSFQYTPDCWVSDGSFWYAGWLLTTGSGVSNGGGNNGGNSGAACYAVNTDNGTYLPNGGSIPGGFTVYFAHNAAGNNSFSTLAYGPATVSGPHHYWTFNTQACLDANVAAWRNGGWHADQ